MFCRKIFTINTTFYLILAMYIKCNRNTKDTNPYKVSSSNTVQFVMRCMIQKSLNLITRPIFSIQAPIVNRFGEVFDFDVITLC